MPRQVYSREVLARLRARGNDGTFLDSLERAVHAANVCKHRLSCPLRLLFRV
jgi:hypothetical protein